MNTLIVESAAKARTLSRYLGEGWRVVATGGHVETLPDDRKKHGKELAKAMMALFSAWYCYSRRNLAPNRKTTPAMAAGVTDHVWTIEELLREAADA